MACIIYQSIQFIWFHFQFSVKKSITGQDLQAHAQELWGLLPAFCGYPTDTRQNFRPLAKLLITLIKKDPSMHENIAVALQVIFFFFQSSYWLQHICEYLFLVWEVPLVFIYGLSPSLFHNHLFMYLASYCGLIHVSCHIFHRFLFPL